MRSPRLLLLLLVLTGGIALAACERTGGTDSSNAESGTLVIKGSDTMVHLVTALAEGYMATHPESRISVTGGGSGTGIAAMLNGTTDICMASRKVKESERAQGKSRGITFHEVVVALDGIAIVVHPDNPVDALTLEQLRGIFNGTIQNWKEVGGPDRPILALSRESNSGTYVFFNEHVMQKDDFGPRVRLMPSNAAIVQAVRQDATAIGYVGLGYAKHVKLLGVKKDAGAPPVLPSLETVRDGSYPIARPLHFYTNGEPTGTARAFIAFTLSPEGQRIVAESGYIPLETQ